MTPDGVRELERHGIAGARRDRRRRGRVDHRRRLRRCRRRDRRRPPPTRGRRRWSSRSRSRKPSEFGIPPRRPDAVHLSPPRGVPGRGRGAPGGEDDGRRLRDGAAVRRVAAAARTDERGRRPPRTADGRALPRAAQRRPRRADGRGTRCAARQGRRARRRQRRLERGVDRRGHGGRGRAGRQEPRPAALRRPDPPGPDHDGGVEPRRDRARRRRRRPRHRRRPRRRRPRAGGRERGDGASR